MAPNEYIENVFSYHQPKGDQTERYEKLREEGKALTYRIIQLCPDSRERALALTKIQEAIMWANAAIARNE